MAPTVLGRAKQEGSLPAGFKCRDSGLSMSPPNVMWASAPAEVERRITGTVDLQATDTRQAWLMSTIRWSGQAWGQAFNNQIGWSRRATIGKPSTPL